MRKISIMLVFITITIAAYAGDIANFVNLGFSADGLKYAFGQHGLQDKTYRAYAEIYVVDIAKNDFVPKGVFKISPIKQTEGQKSKTAFLALQNRAQAALNQWTISDTRPGRVIYAQAETHTGDESLFFRDFRTNDEYAVVLHSETRGKAESSFYLIVEKTTPDGSKVKKQIGRPDYMRKGIKGYALKKILADDDGTALIFIIEKNEYSDLGESFRYMVETASFK